MSLLERQVSILSKTQKLGIFMELLYIYIEKYRVFNKQEFSFSDKFFIHYDPVENILTINENKKYFDIYPDNITGISAIVGKNASGKTSLLSLIGDKIEDRWRHNEIIEEESEDPYEKLIRPHIGSSNNFPPHSCEYFLIYSVGQDPSGNNLFVLETNSPRKYYSIFSPDNFLSKPDFAYGEHINYYEGKGWLSCVFSGEGSSHTVLNDTLYYYKNRNVPSIEETARVIYFQKNPIEHWGGYNRLTEEESKISIKKTYALLQERWIYHQLIMLRRFMRESNNTNMYRLSNYKLQITLAGSETQFENIDFPEDPYDASDVIIDYRKYAFAEKTKYEKMALDFMEKYTEYAFSSYINNDPSIQSKDKLSIYKGLEQIQKKLNQSDFESIKIGYLNQLSIIFSSHSKKDHLIQRIENAFDSFLSFLTSSKENHMACQYQRKFLTIHITKNSKIENAFDLFANIIDESVSSDINQEISVMNRFISTNIYPLSEGESENLALFTSLWDQIENIHPEKKDYILLFDEIDRSMHPEMCRRLIDSLINFFQLLNCPQKHFQIIISSHSPFIVGDIRQQNLICLSSDKALEVPQSYVLPHKQQTLSFGQNIHNLLKSQFFMDNTFSQYAYSMIELITECVCHKSNSKEQRYFSVQEVRQKISEKLISDQQLYSKSVPKTDPETVEFLQALIDELGEPMLRNALQEKLDRWCVQSDYLDQQIAEAEGRLKRLKACKNLKTMEDKK